VALVDQGERLVARPAPPGAGLVDRLREGLEPLGRAAAAHARHPKEDQRPRGVFGLVGAQTLLTGLGRERAAPCETRGGDRQARGLSERLGSRGRRRAVGVVDTRGQLVERLAVAPQHPQRARDGRGRAERVVLAPGLGESRERAAQCRDRLVPARQIGQGQALLAQCTCAQERRIVGLEPAQRLLRQLERRRRGAGSARLFGGGGHKSNDRVTVAGDEGEVDQLGRARALGPSQRHGPPGAEPARGGRHVLQSRGPRHAVGEAPARFPRRGLRTQ
jgi:hypothetical protein